VANWRINEAAMELALADDGQEPEVHVEDIYW
jgi:hypothetical protein